MVRAADTWLTKLHDITNGSHYHKAHTDRLRYLYEFPFVGCDGVSQQIICYHWRASAAAFMAVTEGGLTLGASDFESATSVDEDMLHLILPIHELGTISHKVPGYVEQLGELIGHGRLDQIVRLRGPSLQEPGSLVEGYG